MPQLKKEVHQKHIPLDLNMHFHRSVLLNHVEARRKLNYLHNSRMY